MLPEQQQRIMGYFIEEAKDHLNTIEQGLLSLQATIEDSEKANEIFRAAHSVKGGAAMLGLESIQKTAHRMEDYFKILKESPIEVDRTLETMFLRISDGLKDLLEQLEGPFGLTPDKAQEIMADVEPVFDRLESHLNSLVQRSGGTAAAPLLDSVESSRSPEVLKTSFKRDVPASLRQMLATFKQPDTSETRQVIHDTCDQLSAIGEQFELSDWCDLIKTARLAAESLDNDYRTLAPVLIKEIKVAQGLVLSGRASEVAVSENMQALLPEDIVAASEPDEIDGLFELDLESGLEDSLEGLDDGDLGLSDIEEDSGEETEDGLEDLFSSDSATLESDENAIESSNDDFLDSPLDSNQTELADDFDGLFGDEKSNIGSGDTEANDVEVDDFTSSMDAAEEAPIDRLSVDLDFNEIPSELSTLNRNAESQDKADESLDALLATVNVTGPDVGDEELNSLADLFSGDLEELDNTLGGHAFISEEMQQHPERIDMSSEEDLTDLLAGNATAAEIPATTNDETGIDDDLFGGTLTDGEFAIADDIIDDDDIEDLDDFSLDHTINEAVDTDFDHSTSGEESFVEIDSTQETADLTTDMAALSEDLWAEEEDSCDESDLFGESVDALLDMPASNDAATPEATADDLSFTSSDLEDLDLEASLDDLDFGDLSLDDIDADDENISNDSGPFELALDDVPEENALEAESLAIEELSVQKQKGSIGQQSIQSQPAQESKTSPRELDIEFPTLTGVKLQEAEEDIDSFFLDTDSGTPIDLPEQDDELIFDEDQLSVTSSDTTFTAKAPLGEQLDDDPWGELSVESTLTGIESVSPETDDKQIPDLDWPTVESEKSDKDTVASADLDLEEAFLDLEPDVPFSADLDVEQAGADLDELLEFSTETGNDRARDEAHAEDSNAEVSEEDELWDELVSVDDGDRTGAYTNDLDLEEDLEAEGLEEKHELLEEESELDDEFELSLGAPDELDESESVSSDEDLKDESFDDLGFGSEAAIATADEPPKHDFSGDELSDEILADFETAFGSTTSGEFAAALPDEDLLSETPAVDTSDDIFEDDIFESEIAESEQAPANAADTPSALDINDLEIDGLLDFDALDNEPDILGDAAQDNAKRDTFVGEEFTLEIGSDLDNELDGFLTDDELAAMEDEPPQLELAAAEAQDDTDRNDADKTDDFDDLDSLLADETDDAAEVDTSNMPTFVGVSASPAAVEAAEEAEDFGDLERLLEDGPTEGATVTVSRSTPQRAAQRRSGGAVREQNMRVSVSHLDTLSNLVGELVVSRNTLERDQERLRQFLDNLLFQVQQLNDVGQRMRDLYERSLLESSLVSNRRAHQSANQPSTDSTGIEDHATGEVFDALEMDRFTGFHTLSQEMIELIVRVRESSSDIGYTVESSDQVTRQFRQITTQLQEGLNTARMVSFSQAADRLPRAVRDISLKCGKEARLIVEGQDTLIDKMIVENLYDPLTHLVNNAITHGIETPEARKKAGKLPEGSITVRAFYQGNQTVIYVADDGGGIDTEFVKQKAVQKNLISQEEADELSALETYELLFHPGFSTRDQADDFAGRGVGMDVVRTSLAEIRGSVTIDSEMGKGTSFTIRLPLTLSISKALSCVSNQARIAFPMDGVEDMLDVPRDRIIKNEQDQNCVRWRDTLLTFQPVTELLKFNRTLGRGRVYGGSQDDDVLSIIVLRSANTYIAVQVDQVIGEQEIVIKQLEGPVPKPLGIAGATVLGDGRVMPIADVLELIDIAMGRIRRDSASMTWARDAAKAVEEAPAKNDPTVLIVDDSITVRELLSMSFNKVGYRVEQARDGQEAWDKLRSGLPCDLVFCDIEMPRMDGLELLSRMQKDNHLKSIPIAMLTSRGADRHRQMAVDLGASGYFTKPYLEEALLDAAQRMLNGETLAKGRGG